MEFVFPAISPTEENVHGFVSFRVQAEKRRRRSAFCELVSVGSAAGTADCWISKSGFQQLDPIAQGGQFGSAGRNIAQGPGFQQWDFSALKNFRINENKTIQFRGEFFNIFNRANLGLPVNDLNSSNFGQIQTSSPGRLVQFALKFLF